MALDADGCSTGVVLTAQDSAFCRRFSFTPCTPSTPSTPSQMKNVRTYQITHRGAPPRGTACGGAAPQPSCVKRLTTSGPGRLLLTGFPQPRRPGDIQHFDMPSLRGIASTAP